MRKLATLKTITNLSPIDGADAIELAEVEGWNVVVQKNIYQVGQEVVYFEIDSWIPHAVAPFLSKGKDPKVFNGIPGARLKTVKLRGQVSQGLVLSKEALSWHPSWDDRDCLDEALNITLYEKPVPACLRGNVKGNFPTSIPKTDLERLQNVKFDRLTFALDDMWEVTEKLDGSSMTVYLMEGVFGVCSKNLDLIEEEANSFWRVARLKELEPKLRQLSDKLGDVAVQGELIGPGVQGNIYDLPELDFKAYAIYDIANRSYINADQRKELLHEVGIDSVPFLGNVKLTSPIDKSILLEDADGTSRLNPMVNREGIVYKSCNSQSDEAFKVISNNFLLAEK